MTPQFFSHNRKRLSSKLTDSVIVLSAYSSMQRGNDASFLFEQEANFWYLTGIENPDWWLVIETKANKSWLIASEVDDAHQIFDGSLSADKAKKISGVDQVITHSEGKKLLKEIADNYTDAYTLGPDPHSKYYDFVANPAQKSMRTRLKKIFKNIQDCRQELAKLRAIKQPDELKAIKYAVDLTTNTFKDVKKKLSLLKTEYEVEAEFTYAFRSEGAKGHAYDPIVAGGKNACTLHYNNNQAKLQNNTLLLIDVGARVNGYAADITRTYAVGKPTTRQVAVHKAVESAHKHIISLLRPGLAVSEYQSTVNTIMKEALLSLGLLKSIDDTKNYRKYFPHAISHGLGIDVHDNLGRSAELSAGMVLTVEPGIYIPEEGIGVRIEDDILITDDGHLNLSGSLPTSL